MTAKTRKRGQAEREALLEELRHLRTLARQAADNFILRQEGNIETVITCLGGLRASALRRNSAEWKALLSELNLKPEKGRLRDLKEIHEVVRRLVRELLDESEAKPRKNKVRAMQAARQKRQSVTLTALQEGSGLAEGPPLVPPTV